MNYKKLVLPVLTIAAIGMMCATSVNASSTDTTITPDTAGNGAGSSTITMTGSAIPSPTYTVTIPEAITFENPKRVLPEVVDAEKYISTEFKVTAATNHLFANEKKLMVSMLSDLSMAEAGGTKLLYTAKLGNEDIVANTTKTILTVAPTTQETGEESHEATLTAKLDQSTITKAADYKGTVTFRVALTDVE